MTKKDYEKIAKAFARRVSESKAHYGDEPIRLHAITQIEYLAEDMADMLAEDNHRFDRDRFLAACGVR